MTDLPAPIQGALMLAALAGITAVLSGGIPAVFDWLWWATAATAAVFGAIIGWWTGPVAKPPRPPRTPET